MQPRSGRVAAVVALAVAVLAGVVTGVVLVNRDDPQPSTAGPNGGRTSTDPPVQSPTGSTEPSAGQPTFNIPKPDKPNTATPPPDLTGVFGRVKSGTVRLLASTCSGTGIGTAFLTDARTAVAALGSVDRAVAVAVLVRGRPIPATVRSISPKTGLATLRLARPVAGYHFDLGAAPTAGQPVGVVGVPVAGTAPKLTKTEVTATGERGSGLSGLVALKGAADLGLSGAPVVDGSGSVVGMVVADEDETGLMAVPATTLGKAKPESAEKGDCGKPHGPQIPTVITGDAPEALQATLQQYFTGINTGDYDAVFAAFEPGVLRGSRSRIEQGFRTTYDFDAHIAAWQGPNVWVRFDSIFAKGKGPRSSLTCARWSRVFVFRESDGRTRIRRVEDHFGVPLFRAC
jgi:hypothetical protein